MSYRLRPLLSALSFVALCTMGDTARAVLVVYDGFDYAANADMNGLNGGTGWGAATWTGTAGTRQIRTPGSNYTSLSTVGNKAFIQASTAGTFRMLPSLQGGTDGTTVWISFIGQRDPATQVLDRFYSLSMYQGGTASGNERFSIGEPSNNTNNLWGIHFTSTATGRQEIAGDSIFSESFLLARIDYHGDTTTNDDVYLWGNYNISLGEPAIGTAHASSIAGFNLAFDRVALRAGAASGGLPNAQGFFDELRIGTTFADVIGSGAVCGLGDVDCDGSVNLTDFAPIQTNFRKTVATRAQGDLNGDNLVNFTDFRQWKTAYLGGGGSLEGLNFDFVNSPEPAGSALVLLGAFVLCCSPRWSARPMRVAAYSTNSISMPDRRHGR